VQRSSASRRRTTGGLAHSAGRSRGGRLRSTEHLHFVDNRRQLVVSGIQELGKVPTVGISICSCVTVPPLATTCSRMASRSSTSTVSEPLLREPRPRTWSPSGDSPPSRWCPVKVCGATSPCGAYANSAASFCWCSPRCPRSEVQKLTAGGPPLRRGSFEHGRRARRPGAERDHRRVDAAALATTARWGRPKESGCRT